MRLMAGILITAGALLGAMVVFLLLFWFAFPRWWPEVVIRHSPSLGHVMLADFWGRYEPGFPPGMLVTRQPSDYRRFEQQLGDGIYQAMAACDDGLNGPMRSVIISYCDHNLHKSKARALLWQFSDAGDDNARRVVYRHVDSTPQRVDAKTVEERQRRPGW